MLTTKKNGIRMASPKMTNQTVDLATKKAIFEMLMVECGFTIDMVDHVWRHPKDNKFGVAFEAEKINRFFFTYGASMFALVIPEEIKSRDFITKFLDESREFFAKVRTI